MKCSAGILRNARVLVDFQPLRNLWISNKEFKNLIGTVCRTPPNPPPKNVGFRILGKLNGRETILDKNKELLLCSL